MSGNAPNQALLEALGKLIKDVQDLVMLLGQGLSRAKPWQRQLSAHLADIDRQLQVLRMTVAMEKQDGEILEAAEQLAGLSRLAGAALAGSRVDPTTRAAIKLIGDLTVRIRTTLQEARG
ncbi:MAG: hypothetical protein EKK53_06620 [Burkholderiales bacterium]|nr:MAG: hypothetical protein EKK53_06620 [Burkholderiales bacterium]